MKAKILLIAAIIFGTAISSQAQTTSNRTPAQRVKQGVRSGDITKREAHRLARNQRDIRQDRRLAKADGVITPAERKALKREQWLNKRRLHRARNN